MKFHARPMHLLCAVLSLVVAVGCRSVTTPVAHGILPDSVARDAIQTPHAKAEMKAVRNRAIGGAAEKSKATKKMVSPDKDALTRDGGGGALGKDPAQTQRLVVYSAMMHLVVQEREQALEAIRNAATGVGGFLQSLDGNVIAVKVPSKNFQDVVTAIAKLGAVQSKQINGQDVTEKVHDLKTRLKNAENMRERMAKLLDRTRNIEEALRIEKELARIAETIEVMKGKVEYLEHNAAFSSIRVSLAQPRVVRVATGPAPLRQVPFRWVRALGSEISRGSPEYVDTKSKWFSKIRFTMPANYIKYDEERNYSRGMSGSAVLVKVARHKNLDGGTLEFWQEIIERSLQEQRVVTISESKELETKGGDKLILVKGSKKLGRLEFAYRIAIGRTKKRVYVYEAWGPTGALEKDESKIIASMTSLQLR